MKIDQSEIIINTYGPESRNPVPDAAKFGGAAVPSAVPGEGTQPAPAVEQATAAAHALALDPRIRDRR
jgi:hypothetical protein